jgi:tripartite-type tricarboxylate transporter receptor subunit TctC
MGAILGQRYIVENRPGAGTMLAAEYVKSQPADGYTLLFAGANMFAIAPHVYEHVPYKREDFQTISLIAELPMGITVNPALVPAKTFQEFVAYAKANPGKINFGTSGRGGAQHLLGELANMRAGLELVNVPYRGTSQVLTDLIGGHVPVAFDGLLAYIPHNRTGKLRTLAVSSSTRLPDLPDVPTFAEVGYPEMTVSSWGGFVAPAGTPKSVIDKLHAATVEAMKDPQIRERILKDAAIPRTTTPAEFDALIASDYATWGAVVRKLNFKLEP